MAYEDYGYDAMGNVTGYVDQEAEAIALREEEEKKRKEAEERARKENEKLAKDRDNLAVHKQEVTTYANGSKTITNVAEVPATADAPGRPNVPVKGPVAPETFARMQQAESGNRDYDAKGRPITSPVGAMFKNQVMPATAAAPGYGIRPAQAQTPEEYNRVGQEYYQAMLKKFDGNEQAAVAAYNAGPGRVDQNMRKNQGQLNVAQLPQETQGYLNKVLGGVGKVVNAVVPSAQASTMQQPPANVGSSGFEAYDRNRPGNAAYEGAPKPAPVAPVAPEAMPSGAISESERQANQAQGAVAPETMPSGAISESERQANQATGNMDPTRGKVDYSLGTRQPAVSSAGAIDAYQSSQNDPMQLMKLGTSDDPGVPDWIKARSRDRAADIVTQQREMEKAKEQVSQMSDTDLAKSLRKKTEGGSYPKLFLYNLLGMDKSAAEESAKLGMGDDKVIQGSDGKPYMVKIGINGTPIEGFNGETGKRLSAEELVKVAAGATSQKGVSQDGNIYKDPTGKVKGSFVLETRPGQTPVYKEVGSGRIATADEGAVLNKTGVAGTLENQLAAQRQKLMEQMRYVEPTKRMEVAAKFDQENGTTFAKQLREEMPDFFGGKASAPKEAIAPTPMPAGTQVAAQAPAGGPVAPGQTPAAPAPAGQTQADILSARERKKREDEANTQVSVDARQDYNKYVDKEVVAKVPNATKISRIRSAQLDGPDGLLAVPEVAGIMSGGGSAGREVSNIIRDMLTGGFDSVEDLNKRVVGLGLQNSNPKVYNALMTQVRLQQELGPLTIKDTAPVGAISDSEQKMNNSNQVDITRNPAYVAFNLLSKNKFQTDLTQAKADFAAKNPDLNTIAKFNQAWTKEEGKLYKQYDDIYMARAAYVGEHKNTPLAAAAGYKLFPVPAWNAEKGSFDYKGQPYAKKRPPIDSFVK
jgi:hypothetical protein